MSVADRLNELHAEITANETWGGDPDICMSLDSLVVALPEIAAVIAAAEKTAHAYTAEAEDWNDGEFALWSQDDIVLAIVEQRDALADLNRVLGDKP